MCDEEHLTSAAPEVFKKTLRKQMNQQERLPEAAVACISDETFTLFIRKLTSGASDAFGCGALDNVKDDDVNSINGEDYIDTKRVEMMARGREIAFNPAYSLKPVLTNLLNGEEKCNYETQLQEKESVFEKRREVAARIFGERLMDGFIIINVPCIKCGMPLMKASDRVDCQICPEFSKIEFKAEASPCVSKLSWEVLDKSHYRRKLMHLT